MIAPSRPLIFKRSHLSSRAERGSAVNVERKGQRLALKGNLNLSRYHILWARLLSYCGALPMLCKALSTVSCTSNAKSRFTQHVSVRVDGRESLSDVLHDGYEELLKGLMRSRPTAGERQEGRC